MIIKYVVYQTKLGTAWMIPLTSSSYPKFAMGDSDAFKKSKMATFITNEKGIKTEEIMQDLPCNQVLDDINPNYYNRWNSNTLSSSMAKSQ